MASSGPYARLWVLNAPQDAWVQVAVGSRASIAPNTCDTCNTYESTAHAGGLITLANFTLSPSVCLSPLALPAVGISICFYGVRLVFLHTQSSSPSVQAGS